MSYTWVCVAVALVGCLVTSADVTEEDGVLVLTTSNFQSVIDDNEFILVEFYAPWCGHCKALEPEYAKAAKTLSESGSTIKLAKVDATVESELAERHEVKGYPTLKFFRGGSHMDYSGGRKADDIVNWLKKKTGPPAVALNSVADAKAFIEANNVAVVGFFKDQTNEAATTFLNAAGVIEDHVFGITSDEAVFGEYSVSDNKIVLFKKFDDGRSDFEGDVTVDTVKRFVATRALPIIVEFNHETAQKIFGGDVKSHLLLFLSKKENSFDLVDGIKEVAKGFRDNVLCVTINADDEDHSRILEFFGMKRAEVPAMRIIKLEDEMTKYKPEQGEISAENVKNFVQSFLDGKLKPHLLSQDLPEDWDKTSVLTLVASNFDEVAFDTGKNVLVEFYAPWCGHCKQLAPIFDQVGDHFKDDDTVAVAKIDATVNELEHTKISSFPTLKLYKAGDNKVVDYGGERTLEGIIKFIETGGDYGESAPDTMEQDSDDDAPRKDEL